MANGQPTASPAELGEAGLPEIIKDPSLVPEARAFYSSNPTFLEGAEERPNSPEEIEMAAVVDSASQSPNGKVEEILQAVRLMRFQEKGEETGEGFVLLDHELALKGLRWIRRNVKVKEIRKAAIESKNVLNNAIEKHEATLQTTPSPKPFTTPGTPRLSARTKKNRRREQERIERQSKHELVKRNEINVLKEWIEDNPLASNGHLVDMLPLVRSEERGVGRIAFEGEEGFGEATETFVKKVIENPESLQTEFEDAEKLRIFAKEYGANIIGTMMRFISNNANSVLANISYKDGAELREHIPRWLNIFSNFSDEHKRVVTYDEYNVQKYGKSTSIEVAVNFTGIRIIKNSLVQAMNADPAEFADLAYDLAKAAIDTEDPFVRKSILNVIARVVIDYPIANLLIVNSPVATGVSQEEQLKIHDLYKAIEEEGCNLYPIKIAKGKVPKKMLRQYDRYKQLARQLSPNDQRTSNPKVSRLEKVYSKFTGPLTQALEEGELSDSLYLKIKAQKENSPQDA